MQRTLGRRGVEGFVSHSHSGIQANRKKKKKSWPSWLLWQRKDSVETSYLPSPGFFPKVTCVTSIYFSPLMKTSRMAPPNSSRARKCNFLFYA